MIITDVNLRIALLTLKEKIETQSDLVTKNRVSVSLTLRDGGKKDGKIHHNRISSSLCSITG